MPRTLTRTLPTPELLVAGAFRGMRDAPEVMASVPDLALYVQNMVRAQGPDGGGLTGRPGFAAMGAQLGSGGARTCQAVLTWSDATGTRITTALVGGKVYGYTWGTDTWTEVVTAANLSSKSITLDASARVALVPFADGLVVSDGVNTPFWWDGTTGAGGLTKMTAAPVFYGPPTVYNSRLVGIKLAAGDRMTMVWSEPGAPNTGYEAGGYNNAWDNPGGYSNPLVAVAGTNDGIYVFRERVSLAITGAVTSDWATAGTRANLSETVGALSPWAVVVVPQGVCVVDADARPQLFRIGMGEPSPIWKDAAQTVRGVPRASLANVQACIDGATQSLVVAIPEVGGTNPSLCLAYDLASLQLAGVWTWNGMNTGTIQRIGAVVDASGVARIAHAGVDDGRLYAHGDIENGPWTDALNAGTLYIDHVVETASLGYDLDRELVIDQIEAAVTGAGVSAVSVSYETPRGSSTPQTVPLTAGSGLTWGIGDWDEENWAGTTRDQRIRVGTRGRGRSVRVRVAHSVAGETFGLAMVRVRAFASQGNPQVP